LLAGLQDVQPFPPLRDLVTDQLNLLGDLVSSVNRLGSRFLELQSQRLSLLDKRQRMLVAFLLGIPEETVDHLLRCLPKVRVVLLEERVRPLRVAKLPQLPELLFRRGRGAVHEIPQLGQPLHKLVGRQLVAVRILLLEFLIATACLGILTILVEFQGQLGELRLILGECVVDDAGRDEGEQQHGHDNAGEDETTATTGGGRQGVVRI
jgi:hypothetical protein